jgi:hypothetical protein
MMLARLSFRAAESMDKHQMPVGTAKRCNEADNSSTSTRFSNRMAS